MNNQATTNLNTAKAKLARILGIAKDGFLFGWFSRALVHPVTHAVTHYVNTRGRLVNAQGDRVDAPERTLYEDFESTDTADQVAVLRFDGSATTGATGVLNHIYTPGGLVLAAFALGTGQTITPNIVAGGLDIGGDQVATEGWELVTHAMGATGKPFVIGNTPAFYIKVRLSVADVSGIAHLLIGFRKLVGIQADFLDYSDYAAIGLVAGDIYLKTGNDGTDVSTDTTDNWADAAEKTLEVYVDGAGAVTYRVDAAAPTTVAAFSFDDGDVVVPFIRVLNDTDLAGAVTIKTIEVGLQGR